MELKKINLSRHHIIQWNRIQLFNYDPDPKQIFTLKTAVIIYM